MIKNVDNNGNVHNVTSIRRPLKWRRFEYLLSNGNLYIDTGVIVNDSTSLIGSTVDFLVTYNSSQGTTIGGAVLTTGSNKYTNAQIIIYKNSFHVLGGFTFSQNDVLSRTVATYAGNVQGNPNLSFLLFARNLKEFTPPVQILGKLKIFSAKFYNNGVLIRDFVPAEYNGLYGLWDLVQDKFYGNLGTGSFTVGPEIKNYEEVEEVRKVGRLLPIGLELYDYILSSGTLWIDTLYKPNNNTRIICDFQFTTSNDYPRIFGCSSGTGWNSTPNFQLNFETGVATGKLGVIIGNNNSWTRTNITGDFNRHTYDLTTTRLIYDGTQIATYPDQTFQCTTNLPIFVQIRSNINVQSNEFAIGKLYSFQIYESDELVRNFLPCTYYGEPGMWDTVENRFYRNSGGGSFILGNKVTLELYEYLLSSGTLYIDTGYIPKGNFGTEIKFQLTRVNNFQTIWGSMPSSNLATPRTGFHNHPKDLWMAGINNTSYFGTANTNVHTLKLTFSNGTETMLLNGSQAYTGNPGNNALSSNTLSIYLFARNLNPISNYTAMKCYYFSINDGSKLVRDYIPCTYNGSPGLWDKLNWKFYGNSGSGSFVVVNKISDSKLYYKRIRPFTIESTEDSNSITLTYINELEDKTGYPTQIEADVWVDGAIQPTLVIIPMNTETIIANLDNGHKARVFIHNHNLQNSYDDGVRISFGSVDEFKAYGDLSSLLEDNMPSYRWVGLFSSSVVNDLHGLILPKTVNEYDYAGFCKDCVSLIDASFNLPTLSNSAVYAFSEMFKNCESLIKPPGKICLYNINGSNYVINSSMCMEMFYGCTELFNAPEIYADAVYSSGCAYMFYNCTSLITMPKLNALTLGTYSYELMFYGCTNLVNVYKLPATTLNYNCYQLMFLGCSSLRITPKDMLPAMTVNNYGYYGMFRECINLVSVPNLPATVLGTNCYREMFYGCTSLSYVPANLLPATTLGNNCYQNMFQGCTSLTTVPVDLLPATTLTEKCYTGMFQNCTSLTNVPNLHATRTYYYCYMYMFDGCTSLTTLPTDCLYGVTSHASHLGMFRNCTSLTNVPNLPATRANANCYNEMFRGCTSLTTVPVDLLPATTLVSDCYTSMFYGCTSLTNVPNLPATTLAEKCYNRMFQGCTSLVNVPSDLLPATTLSTNCYQYMFSGCTSLTTAPELPATTLGNACYAYMFQSCSSLTAAPELPATTLSTSCYTNMFYGCSSLTAAPELPATTLTQSCYSNMFYNCTSLTNAPDLPATTLANDCYYRMFRGCKSLTNAPSILPATTLAANCYYEMFYGTAIEIAPVLPALSFAAKYNCYSGMFRTCRQLKWVKALFTTTPNTSYTANWLNDLPNTSTQIFVKNENATWTDRGVHSIPSNWTIQACEEDDYSYPNSL